MAVRIARSALGDLQAIQECYAAEGVPHVGDECVTSILAHVEMLLQHPKAGRVVPEFGADHVREVIHPPYRVVYLLQEADIVLIRVWRSERELKLPEDEA